MILPPPVFKHLPLLIGGMTDYIHEGVKKSIVLNLDIDTTGDTIEVYAFLKNDESDTGKLLGSVSGDSANTDITLASAATHELPVGIYLIEAWVNYSTDNRRCVHPADSVDHELRVKDRRRVNITS